ncbi:hypothetical protein F4678DRAFT_458904 [Xylaria arbuscula]|nr:hypothetical protein F4678DRAFT_458904 [Xylaria arbuscula]
MYSLVKTLIVLAALLANVSAKCYGTGRHGNWGHGLDAVDGIRRACTELMGTYMVGESRQWCIEEFNKTKWNFDLKNIGYDIRSIGLEQCTSGMSKEVHGCAHGGHRGYWRWAYRADPNAGYCQQHIPPPDDLD